MTLHQRRWPTGRPGEEINTGNFGEVDMNQIPSLMALISIRFLEISKRTRHSLKRSSIYLKKQNKVKRREQGAT
jgi:hypothetical protein